MTVATPATSLAVAPSTTTAARHVPGRVISRVKRSVLPVSCSDPNGGEEFVGTGFRVSDGVVTSSHVVAVCPPATTISFGYGTGGAVATDPSHDLARVDGYPFLHGDPDPTPLRLQTKPVYVGEPLALLGLPELPLLGNPFKRPVTVLHGSVVATNRTQVLTSARGAPETLRDTILVAVSGVAPGQSGGPAVDSAGKVVGVIEGSSRGVATLTPVTYVASLH